MLRTNFLVETVKLAFLESVVKSTLRTMIISMLKLLQPTLNKNVD